MLSFHVLAILRPSFAVGVTFLPVLDATLVIVIISKQKALAFHASLLIR